MLLKHQPYPNLMYWYSPSPTSNLSNPVQFFHYVPCEWDYPMSHVKGTSQCALGIGLSNVHLEWD